MSKLKKSIFEGAATALVTPFKNGTIDREIYTAAWISLINQIKENPYSPRSEEGK